MLAFGSMATGVAMVVVQSVVPEVAQELIKHQLYSDADKLILTLITAALVRLCVTVAPKLRPALGPMAEFFFLRNKPIIVKFPNPVLTVYEEHMRRERLKASQGEIPGWKPPRYLS